MHRDVSIGQAPVRPTCRVGLQQTAPIDRCRPDLVWRSVVPRSHPGLADHPPNRADLTALGLWFLSVRILLSTFGGTRFSIIFDERHRR